MDAETFGLDFSDSTTRVVAVGWANSLGCFSVSLDRHPWVVPFMRQHLPKICKLTAFNVGFDGGFLWQLTGQWLNWCVCTYGLFRQICCEGNPGQKWKLENAELDLLGWPDSNKNTMNVWLKEHGLSKEDIWQAPEEILCRYNALDAEAALQLAHVFAPVCRRFPKLLEYHQNAFLTEVKLCLDQQFRGLRVDVAQLEQHRDRLQQQAAEILVQFFAHPAVVPHVAEYNSAVLTEYRSREPSATVKSGAPSVRWTKWKAREAELAGTNHFNPNSTQQLQWLFFDRLGNTPVKNSDKTGKPSVDKESLPWFGEPGKILMRYNTIDTELGYVKSCLAAVRDGLLHPHCKLPGTVTGRLAGGEEG